MGGKPDFLKRLGSIVGRRHVIAREAATRRFATGFRVGHGAVDAVVRPGSLFELWQVLEACVAADRIMILQAANTGLTGGSTPCGDYDRGVVVINTLRLRGIFSIDGGAQVVCLPGATLHALERMLAPLGREPHSVIGSSCIGASIVGGICNNSGGALVHRGPAYTEFALFARLDAAGRLQLVNNLGIALGDTPEEILGRLQAGTFDAADIARDTRRIASDGDYARHVRDVDAPSPSRFNADPRRLFEASGSAGKLAIFAVRLDTFPAEPETATFYLGTNDPDELTKIRREILQGFRCLPVSGEYIHREAFDVAARYGKDTVIAIDRLGTARLPTLFALQARVDAGARLFEALPRNLSDRLLQRAGSVFPDHLPERLRTFRDRYEHHLIVKTAGDGIGEARAYFACRYPSAGGDVFECTDVEARKAFLHRFAVAGAAIRYRNVHDDTAGEIVALDVALRRDDRKWLDRLPDDLDGQIVHKLYYGHFFCHVYHQDYVLRRGVDPIAFKRRIMDMFDARGAECPAEHNVGHSYQAKPALASQYRVLDPANAFNPGIGLTSRNRNWG